MSISVPYSTWFNTDNTNNGIGMCNLGFNAYLDGFSTNDIILQDSYSYYTLTVNGNTINLLTNVTIYCNYGRFDNVTFTCSYDDSTNMYTINYPENTNVYTGTNYKKYILNAGFISSPNANFLNVILTFSFSAGSNNNPTDAVVDGSA